MATRKKKAKGARRSKKRRETFDADEMRRWADRVLVEKYLEPVEALRKRATREGLTPTLTNRLRAVQMAALGARVPEREARLVAVLEAVQLRHRLLRESDDPKEQERHAALLVWEASELSGDERMRQLSVETVVQVLMTTKNSQRVTASLLVQTGVLVDHKPTSAAATNFAENVELCRQKLKQAASKLRR